MEKHAGTQGACASLGGRGRRFGVRGQLIFTSVVLMAVMIFSGIILGLVAYEAIQSYHTSMEGISDIYALNDALDAWGASMDEYLLSATEMSREECARQWEEIGAILGDFYVGQRETLRLSLANLRSVYRHSLEEMTTFLGGGETARGDSYQRLCEQRTGMLFLSEQMLRYQMEADLESYAQTLSRSFRGVAIFCAILALSILLLYSCSMRMIRAICTPIELLVADAKEIAAGHYDTPAVAVLHDDEMGYLSWVFNDMKRQVCANFKNMERVIELQELVQNTELKALQAQMNPHFLFNVLSVAEEAALCENANQTVEILENTSYILQYSLKCTRQSVSLPEELQVVRAYLFLQEKRFGDRIRLIFSVPAELPALPIPGMSLQPVVENAIGHGVEKMEEGGVVQIQVRERPGYIEVTVCDNGCGIEPELLEAIRRKESIQSQKSTGGIGLVNVIRRMEMFYKRAGLFSISSTPGLGTTVTLQYPCSESEERNV